MVAGGDLKISDQNNWGGGRGGGPEQKIKFGGEELNLRWDLKFEEGGYEHSC